MIVVSNAEAVAAALAKLVIEGYVPPRQVGSAARSIGVSSIRVHHALRRIATEGYRKPSDVLELAPPPKDEAAFRRPAAEAKSPKRRFCVRCKKPRPVADFNFVYKGLSTAKNRIFGFQSWCKDCHVTYQRERYLSAGREAALASIGLEVDADRLLCVVCGKEIKAGQRAEKVELACHATCMNDARRALGPDEEGAA